MDWEHTLVCKAMSERTPQPAVDAKITADFFGDPTHREAWEFIIEHWQLHGESPTARSFRGTFPNYKLVKFSEPYEQVITAMQRRRELELAVAMATEINTALRDDDVASALEAASYGLNEIHTQVSVLRDTDVVDTTKSRWDYYMALSERKDDELLGWPTGFPSIDRATNGLQAEQLVTLVGLPKAGKSMLMLMVAKSVHDAGGKPLFIGFEMSNEEQTTRLDAMRAKIPIKALQTGALDEEMEHKLDRAMRELKGRTPFVFSSDINSATTVSGIGAKIQQYKPDAVFVDGVYLMDDENGEPKGSPQALTNITRGLKRVAQRYRVPIMVTTQALPWKTSRARGIRIDSIGYASSFAQDSDVILGAEDDEEDRSLKRLRIVASRNCPPGEVELHAKWATTEFEELAGWEEEDIVADYADPEV